MSPRVGRETLVTMALCDDATLLAPTVRERMRVLAPCLLVTLVVFVAASGPLGIQPPPGWLGATWIPVVVLAVLCVPILRRRIPDRWIHLASAAVLWCAFAAAIIGFASTREPSYVLILATLLSSTGVLLHRAYALGTVFVVVGACVPLILRTSTPHLALHVVMLLTAAGFAMLINALMRGAIVRLEGMRSTEAEQRRQLADQLVELERAGVERASLQEQLLHAQRLEAIGTLAAGVAHEMNNVLASIGGLASLASEQSADPAIASDLHQIIAQAERGGAMTRGLLAFSRRGQYRKRALRVTEQVQEVVRLLRQTLPKSLDVRAELATEGACIEADPVQFHQILVNLGLNAADAMAGRGVLTIQARTVEGSVELRVTDTGVGMDDATRARIFEPFFTTKAQHKGTGLGLAIVWGIVQAHDGTIEVDSQPAKGTTFRIHLPLTDRQPTAAELARIPAPQLVAAVPKTTVLVVDDEELVRSTTQRQLSRLGMTVLTAGNGVEALAVLDRVDDVSLVILDMKMPVMGGAECFHRIRERCDVPVLITTGYAADVDAQQAVAAGAALIEKPYSTASLRQEITRLIGPTV